MLVVEQKEELDKSLLDAKLTVTVSSANEEGFNPNKLVQAKEVLQRIIGIENQIFCKEDKKDATKGRQDRDNSIMPFNVDPDTLNELSDLKDKFKGLIKDLLEMRAKFTSGDSQSINNELFKTQIVSEEGGDITDYVKTSKDAKPPGFSFWIEIRKPYYKLFLALTIISLVAF